eukprot:UN28282
MTAPSTSKKKTKRSKKKKIKSKIKMKPLHWEKLSEKKAAKTIFNDLGGDHIDDKIWEEFDVDSFREHFKKEDKKKKKKKKSIKGDGTEKKRKKEEIGRRNYVC